MLVGASQATTCAIGDVCKTDTIYQTAVDGAPTQAIYCGPSTANAETWFRDMPTPGLGKSAAVLFSSPSNIGVTAMKSCLPLD